jgi:galactokinase
VFAPGRVNVIGEHTDYNQGLALPFAITDGITVRACSCEPDADGVLYVEALARDLHERDYFALSEPEPATGWRAFVRGAVAELAHAGFTVPATRLEISGGLPQGAGLSSSAALTVALCIALIELSPSNEKPGELAIERIELARICSRIENEWAGAQTGLLDQIASLFGACDSALCIDFQSLEVRTVPLQLQGWRFAIADSGERHAHASSGYNERRAECARACELLGLSSLREANLEHIAVLPEPLQRRARHVLEENERVRQTVTALQEQELGIVGEQLNASHRSLRELYEVSTPAVEATVERLLRASAAGARLIGGGFGGSVLGLFAPEAPLPSDTLEVLPGPGAHVLAR